MLLREVLAASTDLRVLQIFAPCDHKFLSSTEDSTPQVGLKGSHSHRSEAVVAL